MAASNHFDVSKQTWEKDCLSLPVDIDHRTVRVIITPDALKRRFSPAGSSREDLERSMTSNADILALKAIAKSQMASGRVSSTGEVRIDKEDVMAVSLSERIRRTSALEILVRQATRQLEEAIGPASPRAAAFWDLNDDGRAITLRLTDGPDFVDARFELRQLGKSPIDDDLRFIRLWGDLLQKKSDRQFQQMMATW